MPTQIAQISQISCTPWRLAHRVYSVVIRGEVLKSRKIADKSVFGFSRIPAMEKRGKGGDEAKKLRGKHEKAGREPAERPFGSAIAMVSRCNSYGMTSR